MVGVLSGVVHFGRCEAIYEVLERESDPHAVVCKKS